MQIGVPGNGHHQLRDEWLGEPFVFSVAADPLNDQPPLLLFLFVSLSSVYLSSLPGGVLPSPAITKPFQRADGVRPPSPAFKHGVEMPVIGRTSGEANSRQLRLPNHLYANILQSSRIESICLDSPRYAAYNPQRLKGFPVRGRSVEAVSAAAIEEVRLRSMIATKGVLSAAAPADRTLAIAQATKRRH